MKVKNHFDRERVHSNVGKRTKVKYSPEVDKNGVLNLREVGEEDLYGFIQSHADSVNIHRIIERFNRGEADVLSRVQGVFGDFVNVPKSYAELLNRVIEGENEFKQLPLDVRSKFNHSFAEFLTAAGSDEWYSVLGIEKPQKPSKAKKKKVESDAHSDTVDSVGNFGNGGDVE